ncbi:hypothetical protein SAMN06893096_102256 [Geodermatophilus pulveris]|uniref:Uncharacterized protein n=1 Tax=Geodermatophilus pulveris TaxID=1564159 RepID=A0A239C5F2_9ACTN|nr:hypothetical protein [Geodermatophilus pulveris]SNS15340.1 hypothetical protein SAMN06893096_102256 [Geodermatophilus pulveris]
MSAPALTFLAPPPTGYDPADDLADDPADDPAEGAAAVRPALRRGPAPALRMTRGAREAAAGARISDADVRRCLDSPDEVSPDADTPSRTHVRRGTLVVLTAADGTVLRVSRRGR